MRKITRRHRHRYRRRHQRGGAAYTSQEKAKLITYGFDESQIEMLESWGIHFAAVIHKIHAVENEGNHGAGFSGNSDDFAQQIFIELYKDHSHMSSSTSSRSSRSTRSSRSSSSHTPRKHSRSKKATRTHKRNRKHNRKSMKQRGGVCYGRGVGANSYESNYSIYNTNMLKLFPYSLS